MENLKDLKPEVAKKLVAFIDAARDLVGDADCLKAFKLLGVAPTQLTEVLRALGIGLTTASTGNRKINIDRNFDPCNNCRNKNIRCKIVSEESFPRLCEECKKLNMESCGGEHDMPVLNQTSPTQAGSPGSLGVTETRGQTSLYPAPSTMYGNGGGYGAYTQLQDFANTAQPQDAVEPRIRGESLARLSAEEYLNALGDNSYTPIASSSSALPFPTTTFEQPMAGYPALKAETPALNNQRALAYYATHFTPESAPLGYLEGGERGDASMDVRAFFENSYYREHGSAADLNIYSFLRNQSQQADSQRDA